MARVKDEDRIRAFAERTKRSDIVIDTYAFKLTTRQSELAEKNWLDELLDRFTELGYSSRSDALKHYVLTAIRAGVVPQVQDKKVEPVVLDINRLGDQLRAELRDFILGLVGNGDRMAALTEASQAFAAGSEIDDDVLDNILEGFK